MIVKCAKNVYSESKIVNLRRFLVIGTKIEIYYFINGE